MAEPRVIRQLRREHRDAARLLDLLEAYCVRMLDIMRYMTDYPDLFHHPREDLMLGKLVERDPGARPMAEDIMSEHREIADKGKRFWRSIRAAVNVPGCPPKGLESEGREYTATLRAHMRKEETEVFPAATSVLTPADWSEIERAVATREDPLFGRRVAAEYEALYAYIEGLSGR